MIMVLLEIFFGWLLLIYSYQFISECQPLSTFLAVTVAELLIPP